jgi:predicted ester cyclase
MTARSSAELWDRWVELWNGDLELANEIIHPDFTFEQFPPPQLPGGLAGRERLVAWVTQTRALFPGLRFTVEVGPIVDGETAAARWVAEGTYGGGIPGTTAPPGTRFRFHGTDIWRAEDGLIREYWLSDDLLDLFQQLGLASGG